MPDLYDELATGDRTFDQVFEVRLAIESQTVALAARRRTQDEITRLELLVKRFQSEMND